MLDSSAKVTRLFRRGVENSAAAKEPGKAQAPPEVSSHSSAAPAPKGQNVNGPSRSMRAETRDRAEQQTELRDELPVPQARSTPSTLRAAPRASENIALPGRRQPWFGSALLFVLIVLLPFASFAYYLLFIASPRYVAEFRFSVTQATPTGGLLPPAITSSGSASSLTSLASSLAGASSGAVGGTLSTCFD